MPKSRGITSGQSARSRLIRRSTQAKAKRNFTPPKRLGKIAAAFKLWTKNRPEALVRSWTRNRPEVVSLIRFLNKRATKRDLFVLAELESASAKGLERTYLGVRNEQLVVVVSSSSRDSLSITSLTDKNGPKIHLTQDIVLAAISRSNHHPRSSYHLLRATEGGFNVISTSFLRGDGLPNFWKNAPMTLQESVLAKTNK